MCDFISWIEKGGEVFFCDNDDIRRGRKKGLITADNEADIAGHGMIRLLYGFEGGKNKECTDLSILSNIPSKIVAAIKSGKLSMMGVGVDMLVKPAEAQYRAIVKSAQEQYRATEKSAFWDIFSLQENRIPAWRDNAKTKKR